MSTKIEIKKDLADVSTAVAEINKTQAGIAELRKKFEKVIFEVSTTAGMTEAKKARAEIREPRFSIEHLRKDAKAPVLALGRSLDAMAADLTKEILDLEEPIDAQIKAEEQRVADEKQALIDAETKRREDIMARIRAISDSVDDLVNSKRTSDNIAKCVAAYKAKPVDESFAEFQESAETIWQTDLARLENHLAAVIAREAEEAEIAAERAELVKLREQQELREAADARAREEQEAARHAQAKIDREKQDKVIAEQAAALEKQRKEQAEAQQILDEENARIVAENKRIADENAAIEQKKRDEEHQRIVAENAENARQVAAQEAARRAVYPGDEAIMSALSQHFGVPAEVSQNWIKQLKRKKR